MNRLVACMLLLVAVSCGKDVARVPEDAPAADAGAAPATPFPTVDASADAPKSSERRPPECEPGENDVLVLRFADGGETALRHRSANAACVADAPCLWEDGCGDTPPTFGACARADAGPPCVEVDLLARRGTLTDEDGGVAVFGDAGVTMDVHEGRATFEAGDVSGSMKTCAVTGFHTCE